MKGTSGVILVYDITNKETFDLIQGWIEDINENNKADVGKVLLGNKLDLEDNRQVPKEDAEQLAKELGCKFFEGSAKTGENIQEALDEVARISFEKNKSSKDVDKRKTIKLKKEENSDNQDDSKKKKCC